MSQTKINMAAMPRGRVMIGELEKQERASNKHGGYTTWLYHVV
jgi:hypothetical protein